jgi:hypothetical protein
MTSNLPDITSDDDWTLQLSTLSNSKNSMCSVHGAATLPTTNHYFRLLVRFLGALPLPQSLTSSPEASVWTTHTLRWDQETHSSRSSNSDDVQSSVHHDLCPSVPLAVDADIDMPVEFVAARVDARLIPQECRTPEPQA